MKHSMAVQSLLCATKQPRSAAMTNQEFRSKGLRKKGQWPFQLPIQRAVAKTNVVTDHDQILGKMDYSFRWNATAPHNNGYIIQKITRTETVAGNDQATVTVYWEAWKVTNGVIYNGNTNLTGRQHDSWYNSQMNAGTSGSIRMDGAVYFSSAESIDDMEHGGVAAAGQLLASDNEPDVDKTHIFDHSITFNWDRRLTGDNINAIIQREMDSELEASADEGDSFADHTEDWENDDWEDFAECVNAHDPDRSLTVDAIRQRIAQV